MASAQLTYRKSLRDIESSLRAQAAKLYHLGIRGNVSRNTLANANATRDWRIYASFAERRIGIARGLYAPPCCLYPLRAPRTGALPSASFRSPVAQGTLGVQRTFPVLGCVGDLHPQVSAPCQAHGRPSGAQRRGGAVEPSAAALGSIRSCVIGAPGAIRTRDLSLRRRILYPAELRAPARILPIFTAIRRRNHRATGIIDTHVGFLPTGYSPSAVSRPSAASIA